MCLVLAVTPLRVVSGSPALARFRRMLGLMVYFYATLHALSYIGFDMGFEWGDVLRDIGKRPFILVGFVAFVFLTLLAATSFNRAIRSLGRRAGKHSTSWFTLSPCWQSCIFLDACGEE